jgi:hypothetical protein
MTITPCLLALVRIRHYLRERPLSVVGRRPACCCCWW